MMTVDEILELWLQPRCTTCHSASITVITDQKGILLQRRSGIHGTDLLQDFGGAFRIPLPLVLACDLSRSELHMEANLAHGNSSFMSAPTLVSPEPWTHPWKGHKLHNTHWCQVLCLRHRDIQQHDNGSLSYAGVPIWSRELAWKSHQAWGRFDLHSERIPGDSIVQAGQICYGKPVFELHDLPSSLHGWSPSFRDKLRDPFTLSAIWPMLQDPQCQTVTQAVTHRSLSCDFHIGVRLAASAWDRTMGSIASEPWKSLSDAESWGTLWDEMWRLQAATTSGCGSHNLRL